jgi:putative intracellular protease/amidase
MSVLARRILGTSVLIGIVTLFSGCASTTQAIDASALRQQDSSAGVIAHYQPRLGHKRPLIAIVGDNAGTELSDFVVPFGVLSEADVADVVTVSTKAGPISTFTDLGKPGFRIVAQSTLAEFDARHPEGADYIIVPALSDAPDLVSWIAAQSGKGGTLVSICNGGMVVAETGIMKGRHATAHWSTESHRLEHHSDILWEKNARYVVDGNWVSSAGVSASIPTSVALIEAIAGHDHAAALAQRLGVTDWSARHDSDAFQLQLGTNSWPLAKVAYTNRWFHADEIYGIEAAKRIDEIALALTIDAYSSTGRSQAYVVSPDELPITTRHGLTILPDRREDAANAPHEMVRLADDASARALDKALDGIAARYGRTTAYGVALVFEYPDFKE